MKEKMIVAVGMIAFVLALTFGACLAAKADSPRYECKNGKCTLLPRPRLEAAPTPADVATKPVEQPMQVLATVDCIGAAKAGCTGAEAVAAASDCGGARTARTPVRSVLSQASKVRLRNMLPRNRGCGGS